MVRQSRLYSQSNSIPPTTPLPILSSSSNSNNHYNPNYHHSHNHQHQHRSSVSSASEEISYSANVYDLRSGSSHLADLALYAESVSSTRSYDNSTPTNNNSNNNNPNHDLDDYFNGFEDEDDEADGPASIIHNRSSSQTSNHNNTHKNRPDRISIPAGPIDPQRAQNLSPPSKPKSTSDSILNTIIGERERLVLNRWDNHKKTRDGTNNPTSPSVHHNIDIPSNYGSLASDLITKLKPSPSPPSSDKRSYFASKLSISSKKDLCSNILGSIPPVTLGLMMNILDGVSYGMIMFPTDGNTGNPFDGFGGIGVSMFFVTCVISQLVYSLGGSSFRGASGSMMVESVPFMHVIANQIIKEVGPNQTEKIISTTMVAFALSSILTGVAFFLLGALRLGRLMGFFPRHILVGCIGSVGVFLLITGIEVTGKLTEKFSLKEEVISHLLQKHIAPLWTIPLGLAVALRLITRFFPQPFIIPAFFIVIPGIFYIIVAIWRLSLDELRQDGWIFQINTSKHQSPFAFYTLFKFGLVDLNALRSTITAQLAMVFFGLLHVPLNVPALALSTGNDDVDVDRELIAHGISNTLAGAAGTVSNYLCYINSVLFTRVGGESRVTGVMLAVATSAVFAVGPTVIAYIPVSVVGALIYVLGIDLIKEAVWDTLGKVSWVEYGTIWAIIIFATWHDFVIGIVVGIVLACMSFVVTSSQHRAIRTVLDGKTAISTVRRHPTQHAFLKQAGTQTRLLKLQGHLFFGTISACEQTIKHLLNGTDQQPIKFLIVDFSSTVSIDFSAVEAFLRIHRRLRSKNVTFVICGVNDDRIGRALRSFGLWSGNDEMEGIEVFEFLNEALEHCENEYLKSLYFEDSRVTLYSTINQGCCSEGLAGDSLNGPQNRNHLGGDYDCETNKNDLRKINCSPAVESSNKNRLQEEILIGNTVKSSDRGSFSNNKNQRLANLNQHHHQPLSLLIQTFKPFLPDLDEGFWARITPLLKRVEVKEGETIWKIGSRADCFYLIEKGILRASYGWPEMILNESSSTDFSFSQSLIATTKQDRSKVEESMLPGTLAGDFTFLAELLRNTNVVAEVDSVLWRFDVADWKESLRTEERELIGKGLMKMAAQEEEVLIGHLFTRF